jgi:Rrf2 family transcriptional regulator, nitric oxide-sensitive transcriptional repressor
MIFKLQRKTDLALSALRCLGAARDNRLTGVELADAIETTMSFLPQVMTPLLRSGWVVSERGPGGGYLLAPDSPPPTIYDVIEVTEGPTINGRCVLRDAPCPGDDACQIHFVADEARAVLIDGFRRIPAVETSRGFSE